MSLSPGTAGASQHRSRSQHRGGKDHANGGKDHGNAGQGSWLSSVVNLVNTIVGAGVLAMPLAISHMGILLGVFVILWAGLTAGFGLYLQTRCARYLDTGASSFFALSQISYPRAAVIFDAAIAVKCFGVAVSYLIIIGDLMPGVIQGFQVDVDENTYLTDRHFWITAFMLVVIPFSFLRRLDSLKYTSVVALISIGYLVVLVIAHLARNDTASERGPIRPLTWQGPAAFLSSLPVIVFAFTCHQNMFAILNEMKDKSQPRATGVVTTSIGTAATIYVVVAITGYLSFGDNVSGNIVGMYLPSVASTIGKAAIVVLVMFSYPLQVHPCRASLNAVLKWRPSFGPRSSDLRTAPLLGNSSGHSTGHGAPRADGDMSETRFAAITTVIVILSYFVAMTVASLEKVLAYVGSTGSTSISFILPGLFFWKISSPDSPQHQRLLKEDDDEEEAAEEDIVEQSEDTRRRRGLGFLGVNRRKVLRRCAFALACYGLMVMITCLITNTFFIVAH